MAAVMAHKGHTVVGVDINPAYVAAINQGRAPVKEPGLAGNDPREPRAALRHRRATRRPSLATDVTFIIVPTPSGPDGRFSMRYVLSAAGEDRRRRCARRTKWHLVVLSSTVMPGSTGGVLLPALEQTPARNAARDFGLCYNPEFIALGSVIRDMLHPDMILIGESDERSGAMLEEFYTGRVREQSANPPHELRERGADQALGQHVRHHQDLLRQHAGAGLRNAARRGRGRGDRAPSVATRASARSI